MALQHKCNGQDSDNELLIPLQALQRCHWDYCMDIFQILLLLYVIKRIGNQSTRLLSALAALTFTNISGDKFNIILLGAGA